MKKILNLLILLSLVFVSCKDDSADWDNKPIDNKSRMITFSVIGNNQKGDIIDNNNFNTFNVYAYHHNAPTTTPSAIDNIDTIMRYFRVYKNNNNYWHYHDSNDVYWPDNGYVSFFGVSTNDAEGASGVSNWINPDQTEYPSFTYEIATNASSSKDLIVAKALDKQFDGNKIDMQFQHLLTRVNITIKNDFTGALNVSGRPIRIRKITIKNAQSEEKYTFDSNKGKWTITNNQTTDIAYWTGNSQIAYGASENFDQNLFLIPKGSFIIYIELQYQKWGQSWLTPGNVDYTSVNYNLNEDDMGKNKRININLTNQTHSD